MTKIYYQIILFFTIFSSSLFGKIALASTQILESNFHEQARYSFYLSTLYLSSNGEGHYRLENQKEEFKIDSRSFSTWINVQFGLFDQFNAFAKLGYFSDQKISINNLTTNIKSEVINQGITDASLGLKYRVAHGTQGSVSFGIEFTFPSAPSEIAEPRTIENDDTLTSKGKTGDAGNKRFDSSVYAIIRKNHVLGNSEFISGFVYTGKRIKNNDQRGALGELIADNSPDINVGDIFFIVYQYYVPINKEFSTKFSPYFYKTSRSSLGTENLSAFHLLGSTVTGYFHISKNIAINLGLGLGFSQSNPVDRNPSTTTRSYDSQSHFTLDAGVLLDF